MVKTKFIATLLVFIMLLPIGGSFAAELPEEPKHTGIC